MKQRLQLKLQITNKQNPGLGYSSPGYGISIPGVIPNPGIQLLVAERLSARLMICPLGSRDAYNNFLSVTFLLMRLHVRAPPRAYYATMDNRALLSMMRLYILYSS